MYLANKTALIAGVVFILIAGCLIANVALTSTAMDKDPFKDDEVGEFLTDVNDNETAWIAGYAVGLVVDGALVMIAGVVFYLLFRDRSRLLATTVLVAFTAGGAIASVFDITAIMLTGFADDFVNGGPPGVAAGDPAALEVGRLAAMLTLAGGQTATTAIGIAFLAMGLTLSFSPAGTINPPRAMGWLAIIAGLAWELSWLIVATDAAFVFFLIGGLATLIFLLGLGGWLIMNRALEPKMSAA